MYLVWWHQAVRACPVGTQARDEGGGGAISYFYKRVEHVVTLKPHSFLLMRLTIPCVTVDCLHCCLSSENQHLLMLPMLIRVFLTLGLSDLPWQFSFWTEKWVRGF